MRHEETLQRFGFVRVRRCAFYVINVADVERRDFQMTSPVAQTLSLAPI